jgi:hypothetical protein
MSSSDSCMFSATFYACPGRRSRRRGAKGKDFNVLHLLSVTPPQALRCKTGSAPSTR